MQRGYRSKPLELQALQPLQVKKGKGGKDDCPPVTMPVTALSEPDADAIEERAALAADRVPGCYLDAWARLQCQRPHSVAAAEWRLAVNDAGLFLDAWGADAAAMGWSAGALYDVPRADRTGGLVWQLIGAGVEALGADHARASDGRVILKGVCERRPNSSIGNEERGGA